MDEAFWAAWRHLWMLQWPLFISDLEDARLQRECAEDGGHCSCYGDYPCCMCGAS